MANNLTGAASLAYQGTNAASPPNITVHYNRPTANFYQGFSIGDFWIYRVVPTSNNNELWVLMGVSGNVANWVLISNSVGAILELQGNTGGPVGPTSGVINIVGSGDLSVTGDPSTSTLTIGLSGGGNIVSTLTGNSGGAVSPTSGNINVVGDGTTIDIVGDPATHTLTASAIGSGVLQSLTTDDLNVVTPTNGTINILGGNNITTEGTVGPDTVTINVSGTTEHCVQVGNASGSLTSITNGTTGQILTANTGADPSWQNAPIGTVTTLHTDDGHDVTATSGVINIAGGTGITTTGTVGPNTVTVSLTTVPAAYVFLTNTVTDFCGDSSFYIVPFDTVAYDNFSAYDMSTGYYTIPVTGLYVVSGFLDLINIQLAHTDAFMNIGNKFDNQPYYLDFQHCNPYASGSPYDPSVAVQLGLTGSAIIPFTAGQTVGIGVSVSGVDATKVVGIQGVTGATSAVQLCGFSIAMISAT